MTTEQIARAKREIMSAALGGIALYLQSTRGAALLGASASVATTIDDDKVLQVLAGPHQFELTIREQR